MTSTRNLSIREANLRTIRDIEARIPAARTSAIDECIEVVKARAATWADDEIAKQELDLVVSQLEALRDKTNGT